MASPNIITRENYTHQQTQPPTAKATGWGYFASMGDAPSASAYGVGYAWIAGSLYWSDGSTWTLAGGGGSSGPVYALTSGAGGVNVSTWDTDHGGLNTIEGTIYSASILGGAFGGQCNGGGNAIGKDIPASVDLSNPADTVTVQGLAATTINWSVSVRMARAV